MTVRIGITGPIGCGKSTVAGWLAERWGVVAVDADDVARDVLAAGTPEVEAVYAKFGEGLRAADGTLDRPALARIVFADPVALRDLESIVHPAVRPRILEAFAGAEAGGAEAIVIEAIKLVEGGLADLCDEVWLVTCDPGVQAGRLVGRGSDADDAAARIAAQGDLVSRLLPRATRVIDTSGDVAATRALVHAALQEALASSGRS
ncbi:MAG: dephospho-CoA kinase [Chloroflexota bacterium]